MIRNDLGLCAGVVELQRPSERHGHFESDCGVRVALEKMNATKQAIETIAFVPKLIRVALEAYFQIDG